MMAQNDLSPLQFLQDFYGCDNCTVTYRICEGGSRVLSMPMDLAVEKLQHDIDELSDFMRAFGVEEYAKEATFNLWLKKLVAF